MSVLMLLNLRRRQAHLLSPSAKLHFGAGNDMGAQKAVTVDWSLGV